MMDDQEYAELVNRVRDAEKAARLAAGKWKRVKEQEAVALWLDLRRAKIEREKRAA